MIHVITDIRRPRKELIDKFRGFSTATVHVAFGRKGSVDCGIKPIAKEVRIWGPAFTVQCHPGDNLMLHKALEKAQSGDVIVASVGGYHEAGYWGALMATSAMARNLGGLAIDGCVRDSVEIADMGFPVFCRGFCIRRTTKAILGLINYPTLFGGVVVNPGDFILGNDDGIVVIGRDECEPVLEKTLKRIDLEKKKSAQLRKGISSVGINKLDKVFESLRLIEQ